MAEAQSIERVFSSPPNVDLEDDAPGDDRTDTALQQRVADYDKAGAMNWLLQGAEVKPQAEHSANLHSASKTEAATSSGIAEQITEIPTQVVGGVRDAAQSFADFRDWVETTTGAEIIPGSKIVRAGWESLGVPDQLPEVREPKGMIGAATRGISQFLAGFGPAGKAIGGVNTFTRAAAAGAASDFLAFDPHQERLADLLNTVPVLKEIVPDYLNADPNDGEIEGRLKNALEGLGVGVMAEGAFRALRAYRSARRVRREANSPELLAQAARTMDETETARAASDLSLLGSARADVPAVLDKQMVSSAIKETMPGVPDDVAARALTQRGLEPLAGADGVYINFARIDAPEDIQRIIQDTASAFKDEIGKAQRGVRTNVQTQLSADKIDAWQTLVARRPGAPLNAEEAVAARQLWATAADKLGKVADTAASVPSPENLFAFRKMLATYHAIQKEVLAARSETARALQSWSIPVGGSTERMRDMTAALDFSGGPEVAASLARRIAQLSSQEGGAGALSKFVEKGVFARTLGTVQEYWINALLSGPKTHMVNMLSNASVAGLAIAERGVASRLGRVFLDDTGVELGEATAQLAGLRGGVIDAFRNAGKALRTGQTGFGVNKIELPRERYISSGTWNVRSESWAGRFVDVLGTITNAPGRLLQAEDEFFKTLGYRMELNAQAQRIATRDLRAGKITSDGFAARVSDILENPPESIRMEAVANAAYQTFTSQPGRITRGVHRLVSEITGGKFILPFINTPANIMNYTFERTPLAPLTAKYRNAMAKGGVEADLALTRMSLGTATMMFATDLALSGHITGSGPENTAERQNWRRQGNQPYSLRLGDKWVAFNRFDPIGFTLGLGADYGEWLINVQPTEETGAEAQEGFAAGVFAFSENLFSKTYLKSLALLTEAINEPDRYGARFLERFASSFVPTGVAEVARFVDPAQRQAHDIITGMKMRVPGFSQDLAERRDIWGRVLSYESGFGRGYDAISPFYGSVYKPEPIDQAMQADGWFFGMGGHAFTVDGETVSLRNRPDIKNRYYQLRGATKPADMNADWLRDRYGDKTMLETLNGMVGGKGELGEMWKATETPDDRHRLARGVFEDYGDAARDRILDEYPWIEETAGKQRAARNWAKGQTEQ